MSNVVDFPSIARLRARLEDECSKLAEGYEKLHEGYALMESLEKKVADLESKYQNTLIEYGTLVGPNKIEVKFLEYSNNLVVNLETGEVGIGVFTPDEGDQE